MLLHTSWLVSSRFPGVAYDYGSLRSTLSLMLLLILCSVSFVLAAGDAEVIEAENTLTAVVQTAAGGAALTD